MVRDLTPVGEGLALVIDRAILELLKMDEDTRVELSTDGRRLIIEPVRTPAVSIHTQAAPPAATAGVPERSRPQVQDDGRLADPKATVRIIDELTEHFGMSNEQFREMHHARNYLNTIQAHRTYCDRPNGGEFRLGGTNYRTALRLQLALEELRAGQSWPEAIKAALGAYPK